MNIEGQNTALREYQAEQCQLLTDLECQRVDIENIQTFMGVGEPGQQAENLRFCEDNYTNTIPDVKNQFTGANIDQSHDIATLACAIGKPS